MAKSEKTKRRAPRKRNVEATRGKLLAGAEAIFAEKSFEGATYDLIAEAAGVNKALIAYHFGSKEGLYDAVVEALASETVARVGAAFGAGGDPEKQFRAYICALAAEFWRRPTIPAIIMREYLGGRMQERPVPFRAVLQFFQMTERLYEAGRRAGVFCKLDPQAVHLAIVSPLIHFVITAGLRRRAFPKLAPGLSAPSIEDFAKSLGEIIVAGLRRA
jgi:AcrR family transcriptional regulator